MYYVLRVFAWRYDKLLYRQQLDLRGWLAAVPELNLVNFQSDSSGLAVYFLRTTCIGYLTARALMLAAGNRDIRRKFAACFLRMRG